MISTATMFGLFYATYLADTMQAKWLLGELASLPSYYSFALKHNNELLSGVYSDELLHASEEIVAQYWRLTKVSPKAFYLAYQASRLKCYLAEKDPEWRAMIAKPDIVPGVEGLVPFVGLELTDSLSPHFDTLFWLMFDDPSQTGRNPWKFSGNEPYLIPNTLPISGISINCARIPKLDDLLKLKKRVYSARP